MPFLGNICILSSGRDWKYIPMLDNFPPSLPITEVPFNDYWEEIVLIDKFSNKFSRKDIVLAVANQDGGAHIDPILNDEYAKLSRLNSLGWNWLGGNNTTAPLEKAELAAIRHIAHEVLKTLDKNYPRKIYPITSDFTLFANPTVTINDEEATSTQNQTPIKIKQRDEFGLKIGRNSPCPCGAKKNGKPIKYKYCCESNKK